MGHLGHCCFLLIFSEGILPPCPQDSSSRLGLSVDLHQEGVATRQQVSLLPPQRGFGARPILLQFAGGFDPVLNNLPDGPPLLLTHAGARQQVVQPKVGHVLGVHVPGEEGEDELKEIHSNRCVEKL